MHSVEHYIGELLLEHDCVTVPNLGGFITQPRPARLVRDKRRIYPPGKIVSFNSMLTHNDGLLASAFARHMKMSYRDALVQIEDYASRTRKTLAEGQPVSLEGLGHLEHNRDGKIVFHPLQDANLAASSFGLESFFVYPVVTEEHVSRHPEKPVDRKPRPEKKKSPAAVRWTVAMAMPVILFLLYGIIFPFSLQDFSRNYSGVATDLLQPGQRVTITQPAAENQGTMAPDRALSIEPAQETDATESKDIATTEAVNEPVPGPEKNTPPVIPDKKYYIIGGCFENKTNALKFQAELRERGYDGEEAGTNQRGHIRISYKSFDVRQEAVTYLDSIKEKENPSAWLLKY